MTTILLRKSFGGLSPATDEAFRVLGSIGTGVLVLADIKDPRRRSNRQHAYWFSIITFVWENNEAIQKQCGTFDNWRSMLLIHLGYRSEIKVKDGQTVFLPQSVSFAKMPQEKFTRLLDHTFTFSN